MNQPVGSTSHSVVQVEKNPIFEGHGTMQPTQRQLPTEHYNTLVQVGGRNSNDHVVLPDSTPTYAMLK